MARQLTKRRKQVVLKRDERGRVISDRHGRPMIDKTIRRSRQGSGSFAKDPDPPNGEIKVTKLTPEELERYRQPKRLCSVPPVEDPTLYQFSRPKNAPVSE